MPWAITWVQRQQKTLGVKFGRALPPPFTDLLVHLRGADGGVAEVLRVAVGQVGTAADREAVSREVDASVPAGVVQDSTATQLRQREGVKVKGPDLLNLLQRFSGTHTKHSALQTWVCNTNWGWNRSMRVNKLSQRKMHFCP